MIYYSFTWLVRPGEYGGYCKLTLANFRATTLWFFSTCAAVYFIIVLPLFQVQICITKYNSGHTVAERSCLLRTEMQKRQQRPYTCLQRLSHQCNVPILQPSKGRSDCKELKMLCAEDEQSRTCWMTAFRLLKVLS